MLRYAAAVRQVDVVMREAYALRDSEMLSVKMMIGDRSPRAFITEAMVNVPTTTCCVTAQNRNVHSKPMSIRATTRTNRCRTARVARSVISCGAKRYERRGAAGASLSVPAGRARTMRCADNDTVKARR